MSGSVGQSLIVVLVASYTRVGTRFFLGPLVGETLIFPLVRLCRLINIQSVFGNSCDILHTQRQHTFEFKFI